MTQFIHSIATRNLGDLMCCPLRFFPSLSGVEGDYSELGSGPVVFGGGGIHAEIGILLAAARGRPRIVWGMGTNFGIGHAADYPDVLSAFEMVGCRDWRSKFEYVPCPTCMDSAFDAYKSAEPKFPVVIYEQWCMMVYAGHRSQIPVLSNRCSTMDQAVSFLASGDTVVTNSYHGAYWALLLGRKVVGCRLPSNKFAHMPYPVENHDEFNPGAKPTLAQAGYLHESREINLAFSRRVSEILMNQ